MAGGERVGGLRMWPGAHPQIYLERAESFSFSIKTWIDKSGGLPVIPAGENTSGIARASERPAATSDPPAPLPQDAINTRVRTESAGSGYWLDVDVGPIDKAGVYRASLVIPDGFKDLVGTGDAMPDLTVIVVDSSIAVSPSTVDLGAISIANLGSGLVLVGALNVRKLFGSFKIVSVTSSVPFLSFDVRTIVKNMNYVIRIRMDSTGSFRPGAVNSSILVMTDDPKHLTLEVPVRAILVP